MARRGESVRAIAKQLECSRNTVRRYLRDEDAQRYSPREPRACKLDEFKPYLCERVEQAHPRRTLDHDGIEHGLNLRHAVCVGSRHDEGQRDATPDHQQMALAAVFPRSVGLWSATGPTSDHLRHFLKRLFWADSGRSSLTGE